MSSPTTDLYLRGMGGLTGTLGQISVGVGVREQLIEVFLEGLIAETCSPQGGVASQVEKGEGRDGGLWGSGQKEWHGKAPEVQRQGKWRDPAEEERVLTGLSVVQGAREGF